MANDEESEQEDVPSNGSASGDRLLIFRRVLLGNPLVLFAVAIMIWLGDVFIFGGVLAVLAPVVVFGGAAVAYIRLRSWRN